MVDLPKCMNDNGNDKDKDKDKDKLSLSCTKGYVLKNIEPNENDENSASVFYFQVPSRDISKYMLVVLMAEIIEQPFYDDLRTRQQLGYIVGSGVKSREGVNSLYLIAQSSVVDDDELSRRIETFLDDFVVKMSEINDSDLESYKEGIVSRLLEPDQRLTQHANRLWGEIITSSISSSLGREFEDPVYI